MTELTPWQENTITYENDNGELITIAYERGVY
jgi:hypothetical protein